MLKRFIIILILLFQGFCFAYIKQEDEYSCGVYSAYNLIEHSCAECKNYNKESLQTLLKTDTQGTTAQNLCEGLERYFKIQDKKVDILYYGIKKVPNYKVDNKIDLVKAKALLDSGYNAILNIGVYEKNKKTYNRVYGHYVNLISISGNYLIVFDTYDENENFNIWKVKKVSPSVNNINDNEEYEFSGKYFKINSEIPYLSKKETAILNGIIFVKPN